MNKKLYNILCKYTHVQNVFLGALTSLKFDHGVQKECLGSFLF